MATSDKEQKSSLAVPQHKRMAMGGNVNGKTQTGTAPQTKKVPA